MSNKSPAHNTDEKKYIIQFFNSKNEIDNIEAKEETKPVDEATERWNMNRTILRLYEKGMQEDQQLRKTYAKILIGILIVTLISLIVLFILRGINILNYSDTAFNIFVTGGIAEVFILIRTIVKYLFKDNLTQPLNTILESSNKINQKYNKKRTFNKEDKNN